jgi:hypothetical protein
MHRAYAMPARSTGLAREAIDVWLREKARKARQDAIAAYASEVAGTPLDLDPELEAAGTGVDRLLKTVRKPK